MPESVTSGTGRGLTKHGMEWCCAYGEDEVNMARTWISDSNGNRCSVERWGSEEAARRALESLKGCSDCSNCSNCSNCSTCSRCSNCSNCSRCSDLEDSKLAQAPRTVVPKIEDIHKKVYAAASQPDALDMDALHTCETTHCRAGWVVHLAGEAGYALEKYFNAELAAMLIYRESGYDINPCRFYDSDEDAMADMQRLAEVAHFGGVA